MKKLQLFIHRHYAYIRNSIILIVIVFFASTSLAVRADNKKALEGLADNAHQIQTLANANKTLNQQNNALAAKNQRYIKCVATIFANYTHNFVPVTITDLDTCTLIDGNTSGVISSGSSNASPESSTKSASPKPSPKPQASQSDTSPGNSGNTPAPDNRNLPQRLLDFVNPFK